MAFIISDSCPSCNAVSISKQLIAEDYTASHQQFEIWECAQCSLRFTQNMPDALSAPAYYRADSYISHTDTSEGFINKLYHNIRKRTLRKKLRLIKAVTGKPSGSMLDIGAGTGAFANTMQQAGWRVAGLEPEESARGIAASRYGLQLQDIDALFLLPAESFDAITMWHVLEHVHELHRYIEQIKGLLNKNGKAFIAVPNYTSYDAQVYQQYWAAYDVPRHLYHFSPVAMEKLLDSHGLKLQRIKPMWYDSFYISLLSEKYRTPGGNTVRAAWTGLLSNIITLFKNRRCSSVIYIIGKA